jgi:hypothetical protein
MGTSLAGTWWRKEPGGGRNLVAEGTWWRAGAGDLQKRAFGGYPAGQGAELRLLHAYPRTQAVNLGAMRAFA